MNGMELGKIEFAEFGTVRDYPFLMGLQLGFALGSCGHIMDGGKYTVNISPECRAWKTPEERGEAITKIVEFTYKVLKDAKVSRVSDLVGKPVMVTIEKNTFKDFRILTEVL